MPEVSDISTKIIADSVSVILPTENRDFQIDNICESILGQLAKLGSGELVVVDYGTAVGSAEGLRERFKGRERLKVR